MIYLIGLNLARRLWDAAAMGRAPGSSANPWSWGWWRNPEPEIAMNHEKTMGKPWENHRKTIEKTKQT